MTGSKLPRKSCWRSSWHSSRSDSCALKPCWRWIVPRDWLACWSTSPAWSTWSRLDSALGLSGVSGGLFWLNRRKCLDRTSPSAWSCCIRAGWSLVDERRSQCQWVRVSAWQDSTIFVKQWSRTHVHGRGSPVRNQSMATRCSLWLCRATHWWERFWLREDLCYSFLYLVAGWARVTSYSDCVFACVRPFFELTAASRGTSSDCSLVQSQRTFRRCHGLLQRLTMTAMLRKSVASHYLLIDWGCWVRHAVVLHSRRSSIFQRASKCWRLLSTRGSL